MKRRAAETLIEVITAMTVFAIVSAGIFDFMATQTLAIARAKTHDTMLYSAQRWINNGGHVGSSGESYDQELEVSRVWDKDKGTLTLSKNGNTMTLEIK